MARLVLLSFKDNTAAESFVKILWQMQESDSGTADPLVSAILAAHSKTEWMVARPMNYCRCGGKGSRNHKMAYTKTKRFGWWVHAGCNRVSIMVMQKFVKNMLNGSNDLLPELVPEEKPDLNTVDG